MQAKDTSSYTTLETACSNFYKEWLHYAKSNHDFHIVFIWKLNAEKKRDTKLVRVALFWSATLLTWLS